MYPLFTGQVARQSHSRLTRSAVHRRLAAARSPNHNVPHTPLSHPARELQVSSQNSILTEVIAARSRQPFSCYWLRNAQKDVSNGPALIEGLIFYQDFDHQGVALRRRLGLDAEVPADRLVAGRFCRFERPRTNYLSVNQAPSDWHGRLPAGPDATLSSAVKRHLKTRARPRTASRDCVAISPHRGAHAGAWPNKVFVLLRRAEF